MERARACRFRSRADLELEVIALRHQLTVLRHRARPLGARPQARQRPQILVPGHSISLLIYISQAHNCDLN
jgi:hypothetical protein